MKRERETKFFAEVERNAREAQEDLKPKEEAVPKEPERKEEPRHDQDLDGSGSP